MEQWNKGQGRAGVAQREADGEEQGDWERRPGEPSLWYNRFALYLGMGPTRSVAAAYQEVYAAKHHGGTPKQAAASNWKTMAARWEWRARAEAFDREQRRRAAGALRDKYLAVQALRLDTSAELMMRARSVLARANLEELDEAQARVLAPEMRMTVRDMATVQQREQRLLPQGPAEEEEENKLTITADDLRAAERALERERALGRSCARWVDDEEDEEDEEDEADEARLWGRDEAGAPLGRRQRGGEHATGAPGESEPRLKRLARLPNLLLCLGEERASWLGIEALRRLRDEMGLQFDRLYGTTRQTLKERLKMQRALHYGARYVQLAVPAAAEGITCGDGLAAGMAEDDPLCARLGHVAVLVACDFRGEVAGAWLEAPAFTLLLREGIPPEEGARLVEVFWHAIGGGAAPRAALEEALAACSAEAQQWVAVVEQSVRP